jgi:hypothetical protein
MKPYLRQILPVPLPLRQGRVLPPAPYPDAGASDLVETIGRSRRGGYG